MKNVGETHCDLCAWMVENEADIRSGNAVLNGGQVTESTEVVCYEWVVSVLFLTMKGQTAHRIKDLDNAGGGIASMITLLLGWWGIPWGPVYTIGALARNLCGGKRSNVAAIIAEQKWGVMVPEGESTTSHHKKIVEFSEIALVEIEARRERNRFGKDLAIKPVPDDWARRTCRIQFDYPVSDGGQWTFQTQGVSVVIDKSDSEEFDGKVIDFNGDEFLVLERHEVFTRDSRMDGDA